MERVRRQLCPNLRPSFRNPASALSEPIPRVCEMFRVEAHSSFLNQYGARTTLDERISLLATAEDEHETAVSLHCEQTLAHLPEQWHAI